MAKHYGRPRRDVVIEPFAGSACYSTYWSWPKVKLFDKNKEVCAIWDYLIKCSDNDIKKLPDWITHCEQLFDYSYPEERLMARWIWYGVSCVTPKHSRLTSYTKFKEAMQNGGDHEQTIRNGATFWCPEVKSRILKQKRWIKEWTVDCCSYRQVEDIDGHWHIDPPYNSKPGQRYRHNSKSIDYEHLAEWCRNRISSVDVCEQAGAKWLPFKSLRQNHNLKNDRYIEVLWRKDRAELF